MESNNQLKSNSKLGAWIGGIVIIILAALGFTYANKKSDTVAITNTPTPTNPTVQATTSSNTQTTGGKIDTLSSKYKDGTYTAEGSYNSPASLEKIKITLVLQNDIVISANATPEATFPESVKYQQRFVSGYKAYVVGKNIDTLNLTRVSGSSLTPEGFNDAVAQIKTQAKA